MRDASSLRNFTASYGLAHGGKTLFWAAGDVYFAFYMTAACGLSAWTMALVLGLSYLFNAATDIVVGRSIAAGVKTPRSAAKMQLIGAISSAAGLMLFALSAAVPEGWRLTACLVTLLLFRVAYSLYDNPQNSLLALVAGDDEGQRAKLAAARNFAGGVAKTLMAASFVPLLVGRSRDAQVQGFLCLATALAIVAVATAAFLRYRIGDTPRYPVLQEQAVPDGPKVDQALPLFTMIFLGTLATTLFTQFEPYVAAYVLKSNELAAAMMISVTLGGAFSQPTWAAVAGRIGVPRLLDWAMALTAIGAIIFWVIVQSGALAAGIAGLVYGIGTGGVFLALWMAAAARARTDRYRRGETATIGRFTAFAKIGQGCAVICIGWALGSYRSIEDIDEQIILIAMTGAPILGVLGMAALHHLPRRNRRALPGNIMLH